MFLSVAPSSGSTSSLSLLWAIFSTGSERQMPPGVASVACLHLGPAPREMCLQREREAHRHSPDPITGWRF